MTKENERHLNQRQGLISQSWNHDCRLIKPHYIYLLVSFLTLGPYLLAKAAQPRAMSNRWWTADQLICIIYENSNVKLIKFKIAFSVLLWAKYLKGVIPWQSKEQLCILFKITLSHFATRCSYEVMMPWMGFGDFLSSSHLGVESLWFAGSYSANRNEGIDWLVLIRINSLLSAIIVDIPAQVPPCHGYWDLDW